MKPRWKQNPSPVSPIITAGYVIAMTVCGAIMAGLLWRSGQ